MQFVSVLFFVEKSIKKVTCNREKSPLQNSQKHPSLIIKIHHTFGPKSDFT